MSSGEEDFRWNAFRSHKSVTCEKPSLTPWMITSLQVSKLVLFLTCNIFLTLGAVISKLYVLVLATNLWDNDFANDTLSHSCVKTPIQRSQDVVAAVHLGLMFIQTTPDIIMLISSFMRFYSGDKAGRIKIYFVVLETLRAFGLSLLVFTVFPQLDLYRCLCLCACFSVVTALQRLLSSMSSNFRPGRSFGARILRSILILPHLIIFLAFLSSTYLWTVIETPFHGGWNLALSIFTISCGFWESWVCTQHSGTALHKLYQVSHFLLIIVHTY
ncbi:hypothetical protein KIN20_036993 [Parelaphostrongylus tenuis]|uniref:Chitin synthase chs-1/2 N-terminal putative transporter domain-containing protein n=1 Tax=Parelaphostrongylus tenuis TaxID=148309 RepID=A0AAD5RDH6_PARTN|nr:hypothetical protein KIN20_036993 [Parelaphostrongylus tenuis]